MMKVKKIFLDFDQFQFIRSFLQHREIYYIAGTNSIFVPSRQEKYILFSRKDGTRVVREWPNLEGEKELMTPGEAARTELRRTFPRLRRVGWQSSHIRLFDWRSPMYFGGPSKGRGVYIDLKGAYYQLYSRLWLDTSFPNGFGTLHLGGIADTLKEWKAARNSIVGVTAARTTCAVKGYKSIWLTTQNNYLSPGLWATIQAALNELAWNAKDRGAVYIATDGYIFSDLLQAQHFEELLYDLGLKYRKMVGNYDIKNWGAYKVATKETKTYKGNSNISGREFCAIRLLDPDNPTRVINWWAHTISRYTKERWQGGIKEWQRVI